MRVHRILFLLAIAQFGIPHAAVQAAQQSPAFTYQGVLRQSNAPVNDSVDLQFKLFDAANAGAQIGATLAANAVMVSDGVFTASLDFGALAINGEERWLEIAVRAPAGSANPFVTLAPRQKLASTPYAVFALQSALSGTYGDSVNFSNNANLFAGSFSGSGAGLTNINPANFTSGTAGISITGNAVTATIAGNVSGIIAIANGGTGATTAAAARTNLGAAATTHTHAAADMASGNLDPLRMPTGGAWALTNTLLVDGNTLVITPSTDQVRVGTVFNQSNIPFHVAPHCAVTHIVSPSQVSGGSVMVGPSTTSQGSLRIDLNSIQAASEVIVGSGAQPDTLALNELGGSVGIGTTAPEAVLHIFDGSAGSITANGNAALVVESSTSGWINILTPDGTQRGILFGDPTDAESGGIIYDTADNDGLQFRTGGNQTRMTLDAAGSLGLGMVPTINRLEVNGNASKSTSGSWLANSDRRIKTDITPIENALETLDLVRLTAFRYTPEYLKSHPDIEQRVYLNVIAQEFAEVFPEHVKGSGEFLKSGEEILQVDIHPLTIYSAAAIQELHEKAKAQAKAIELLQQQQLALEVGLSTLKDDVKDRDALIAELVERLAAVERFVRDAKNNPTPQ